MGISIIGYSPLALGLLSGKYSAAARPPGPRGQIYRETLPKISRLLDLMDEIGRTRGKTTAQIGVSNPACRASPKPAL
eukprot:scaffold2136_cov242-Pinguiococcus_pyrenoidosus.AAC.5